MTIKYYVGDWCKTSIVANTFILLNPIFPMTILYKRSRTTIGTFIDSNTIYKPYYFITDSSMFGVIPYIKGTLKKLLFQFKIIITKRSSSKRLSYIFIFRF